MTAHKSGEVRKREQLALHRERRAVYVRRGQRSLLEHLLRADTATADDVRKGVNVPMSVDPKLFGAVPGPLAKAGIIECSGYRASKRTKAHARPVKVWKLRDREKALRWLAEHPDLPERTVDAKTQRLLPLGFVEGSLSDGTAQTRHA